MNQQNSENNSSDPLEETLTSLVCDTCFGDNLYRDIGIRGCLKCSREYCLHFASKVNPCHYCINCFSDLTVSISDPEVQIIEHYNPFTNQTTRFERRPKGRRITLGGDGYLFALRLVQTMNDAELEMFIQFHRAYLGLLLNEQETKKAEKAHKAAGVKTPSTILTASTATTPIKTTITKTIKTTVSKQDKAREQAKAALYAMFKGTLTTEQIDQMLDAQLKAGVKP